MSLGPDSAELGVTRRARLAEIHKTLEHLGNVKEPAVVAAADALRAERDKLKQEELAAKPVGTQVQLAQQRIDKAELGINKTQDLLESKRQAAKRAQEEVAELEGKLAKQKAELVGLQLQQAEILKGLPGPPSGGTSNAEGVIPGLGVAPAALQEFLFTRGVDPAAQARLSQAVAELRAAEAEYQQRLAAKAEQAPAGADGRPATALPTPEAQQLAEAMAVDADDETDLETCKLLLAGAGLDVPESEPEIRAAVKREAERQAQWQLSLRDAKRAKLDPKLEAAAEPPAAGGPAATC